MWKAAFWLVFSLSILLRGAAAKLLRSLDVPQYAFVGGSVTLTCAYNSVSPGLYSLKWYHNNSEFYRYVPTERDKPINIGPTHKFYLREVKRTKEKSMLNLSKLTLNASGAYRCEVIAERPSFRTEFLSLPMIVLRERLYPPRIIGLKGIYEPHDIIQLTCEPQMSPDSSSPQPIIKWYFNNKLADPEKVSRFSNEENRSQLIVRISAKEVLDAGGSMEAECRLLLGEHEEKASQLLRVRTPYSSYLNNFYSKGSCVSKMDLKTLLLLFLLQFCVL